MQRYTLEVRWTENDEPMLFTIDAYDLDHLDHLTRQYFDSAAGVLVALISCAPVALGAGYDNRPRRTAGSHPAAA